MKSIRDAVFADATITKIAGFKLPKDSMEWNEEILKQFYTEQPDIPKEFQSDAVVNSIDDKAGYAKGSIVVWSDRGRINFPIIVKDWELSPFDVYIDQESGKYLPAKISNIMKSLSGEEVGKPDGKGKDSKSDIKTPGGVTPKESHKEETDGSLAGGSGIKLSFDWKASIDFADFEKFAEELTIDSDTAHQLYKNNPDLVTEIVDLGTSKKIIGKTEQEYKVDKESIVDRIQSATVTSSEMFNPAMLNPVIAPAKVTLRMGAKTMEDIMGAGRDMKQRLEVASSGIPIEGYVFKGDGCSDMFISSCGRYKASSNTFYAMSQEPLSNDVFSLDGKTTDEWFSGNPTPGFDKTFVRGVDSNVKYGLGDSGSNYGSTNGDMLAIYGAESSWNIAKYYGPFSKKLVNGREVYVGSNEAIIKTNIAMPVKVKETNDPVYRVTVGKKKIVMMPELAIIANTHFMEDITGKLLKSEDSIKLAFDMSELPRFNMSVGGEGIIISGRPTEDFMKVAGLENKQLNTSQARTVLYAMGMSKEASYSTVSDLIKSASHTATIYGSYGPKINTVGHEVIEKIAALRPILKEYAESIKINLIKEASSISDDPESVDRMLSLNFINEDNILRFADYSDELSEVASKLSEMLVSSRLGLKDVDEQSLKKAIDGVTGVVEGLNKLKLVIGDK